ncbi:MAG: hypothetical protein GX228_08115 [Firmicutes bacterium]|mgnify:CR=1 FL=1|jgi:N6-L-threonylcarbamoyladenine synthase|nr:hypothetical protein [Bacillota bacterium]NLL88876.1 hypothetical protein [Bacillota bacterium]
MSKHYFLGIDTSNYTTSAAVVDDQARLIANIRQLLPVESGQRGLRQSEAFFWHIKHSPVIMGQVAALVPDLRRKLKAVAASHNPRPMEGSYMPVFVAGASLAQSIGSLLNVPCFSLSHQENHLWAGLFSARGPDCDRFLALHLSGGTSDVLEVAVTREFGFQIRHLGGSSDLHAGQLIDRIGVAMGLPFPSGPDLEKLALASETPVSIPSYHNAGRISFSGAEAAALRLLAEHRENSSDGITKADIAKAVLLNIARTTAKLLQWASKVTAIDRVLLVGGVCANSLIRDDLVRRLPELGLYFAAPEFSVDNAVGAAVFSGIAVSGRSYLRHVF